MKQVTSEVTREGQGSFIAKRIMTAHVPFPPEPSFMALA